MTLRWSPTAITVAGKGSGGSTTNPLNGPYGFTWDSSNALYIAELGGHRISKWVPGATSGTTVAGRLNGTAGSTSDALNSPTDVLLEMNGDMYVVDRANNRLQFFPSGSSSGITKAGTNLQPTVSLLITIDASFDSLSGTGSNTSIIFSGPSTIARNPDTGDLYISNWYQHRIVSYPSGANVSGSDRLGNNNTQLNAPIGFAYDQVSGSLIIANHVGHSLVRWYVGGSSWTLLAGVPGAAGATAARLSGPIGLVLDPMGNIYVADSDNHRIQLFMNGQSEGLTIAGVTGSSGLNSTLLNLPYWVKLDNQLNLYVADKGNHRIQKFQRIK